MADTRIVRLPEGVFEVAVGQLEHLPDVVVFEEPCTGCSWPGRCKAYGSEGCRMKADERLRVTSTRL